MSLPPTEAFPEPGERIGPYEIVRRLGLGGMGVVFEAVDTGLRRRVALKVISPHLADDPTFRVRFTREAQAQASLDSPHVVQVFAHGQADGALYLASQLIPDGDLGALLARSGPPAPRTALHLIAQVAAGLADAHAMELIHRDIKPANVLLRIRGEHVSAYLADFGIARRADAGRGLTTQGFAVGTPSYMAPELHTGGSPGVATDIYSLGCLLWAALTGRAPYSGTTDYQQVSAHVSAPVPQLAVTGPFEREVNRVLSRALAKDPGERYLSARALHDDLRRVLRDHPAPATVRPGYAPARRSSRGPLPVAVPAAVPAAVLAVLAGLAVLGLVGAVGLARPAGDERTAADNIAAALVEEADLGQAEADCTARELVGRAGVAGLQEQGVLDEDLAFVADTRIEPRLLAEIITVGVSCVFDQPSASRIRPATVATYKVPSGPR